MTYSTRIAFLLALAFPAILTAVPAVAQSQRSWVSGTGNDSADCSRATPCQTFAGAYAKTAIAGEINCLDAAGYGVLTIMHSISIVCDGMESGVVSNSTNAIVISAQYGDSVLISGLDISGTANGFNGILINGQASVHLRNISIHNMQNKGIRFETGGFARLTLENALITNNGTPGDNSGGGILVRPPYALGAPSLIMDHVRLVNNIGAGLRVDTVGVPGSTVHVTVDNSQFTGNTAGILVKIQSGASSAGVAVRNATISGNSFGIITNGLGATVNIGNSLITENGTALNTLQGGQLLSHGDNSMMMNAIDGAFSGTVVAKQ